MYGDDFFRLLFYSVVFETVRPRLMARVIKHLTKVNSDVHLARDKTQHFRRRFFQVHARIIIFEIGNVRKCTRETRLIFDLLVFSVLFILRA